MSAQYPLCKAAGLNVQTHRLSRAYIRDSGCGLDNSEVTYVDARDVERWLEGAPKVYGGKREDGKFYADDYCGNDDTTMWRCVAPQPIVRDTAEGLLREFVQRHDTDYVGPVRCVESLLASAKALLERA